MNWTPPVEDTSADSAQRIAGTCKLLAHPLKAEVRYAPFLREKGETAVLKKIKLKDAVGTELAHDITEIRPGEFKGPGFPQGPHGLQ